MSKREIYIPVLYTAEAECDIIREICAGLEEEGVPFITEFCSENLDATELAVRAAFLSPLQVGVGVDRQGRGALHHEKLTQSAPYIAENGGNGRALGKNAARLVKGLPLILK